MFTLRFRNLLMKYNTIIKDSTNISCTYNNTIDDNDIADDLLSDRYVLTLKYNDVCIVPIDYSIYPLDLLNVILSFMILFVLIKLGYDYRNYRKYGKLPWIATKLP